MRPFGAKPPAHHHEVCMTPYRIVDRLSERTSWIVVLIAIIGYAIPLLIPPTAWSHVAGCILTLLGTALLFIPDNRAVVTGEAIIKAVAGVLPSAYAQPLEPPLPHWPLDADPGRRQSSRSTTRRLPRPRSRPDGSTMTSKLVAAVTTNLT
jgi:hypothetical protein